MSNALKPVRTGAAQPQLGGGASAVHDEIDRFESATAEVLAQTYPHTERATLWVLAAMVAAIAVFVSVVKLDRVVTAKGRLVPMGGTITVQPLETQVLNRIAVVMGDVVHKGQVLAYCDPVRAEADRERVADQVASLDAQVRRLSAEEAGKPFVRQPGQQYDELQAQLYDKRRTDLQASLADFDQRQAGTEAQIAGLQQTIKSLDARQRIGGDMEDMHARMSKEGFVSQLQLLSVRDQQIALRNQLSEARASLSSAEHQLAALREQRKGFIDHWHSANLTELLGARAALESARQELTKTARTRDMVNLVAPVDGIVTRVPQLSVGGVAGGAQPMFGLIPLDAPLQAAIKISPNDVGFVKVGDKVNIKFDAFKFLEHGMARGEVVVVSQDAFTDGAATFGSGTGTGRDRSGAEFDAAVNITDYDLRDLRGSKAQLVPGMTLQADIVVGQRTVLWYILGGALRSGAEAMQEP